MSATPSVAATCLPLAAHALALLVGEVAMAAQCETWVETTGVDTFARFGEAVSLDGDRMAVGAPQAGNGDAGAVAVVEYTGSEWVFTANLGGGQVAGDRFGSAVDVEGDEILVGAPLKTVAGARTGAVDVFERGPSGWSRVGRLAPPPPSNTNHEVIAFGSHLARSGSRVAVAAPFYRDTVTGGRGRVYVFERQAGAAAALPRDLEALSADSRSSRPLNNSTIQKTAPRTPRGASQTLQIAR